MQISVFKILTIDDTHSILASGVQHRIRKFVGAKLLKILATQYKKNHTTKRVSS